MLKLYFKIKLFFLSLFLIHYKNFYTFVLKNNKISKSQLFQDLFVQYIFNKKKEGVFIEIGGGNEKTDFCDFLYFWGTIS